MIDSTGELRPQTRIIHSMMKRFVPIQLTRKYIAILYTAIPDNKLMYLMTSYYTPNDGFTANEASFYSNEVGHLHYLVKCFSSEFSMLILKLL